MKRIVAGLIALIALFSAPQGVMAVSERLDFTANGRFVMHGVPKFLLGVYDSGLGYFNVPDSYEKTLFASDGKRKLSELSLNAYFNYHFGEAPVPAMHALMDALDRHGMMYFQTANCFNDRSYTKIPFNLNEEANVREFSKHRAAAGYYIMDECQDGLVAETNAHHESLHVSDPEGKTFATLYSASFRDYSLWKDAADILAVDPYPLYGAEPAVGYSHFKVADEIARLRKAAPSGRPVVSVLQLFKFTSNSRMPTYEEMRSHAVMSIVEGAQGIMWWELGQGGLSKSVLTAGQKEEGFENLKRLLKELDSLQPALLAEPVSGMLKNSTETGDPIGYRKTILSHNISVNPLWRDKTSYKEELAALEKGDTSRSYLLNQSGPIRTSVKNAHGAWYVFAYNYTNRTEPVTFTWSGTISSVREVARGAVLPDANSFKDTFGPYEARIYRIDSTGGSQVIPAKPDEPIQQLPPVVPVLPNEPVNQLPKIPTSPKEPARPTGRDPLLQVLQPKIPPILRNLYYGIRGHEVKNLQRILIRSGFLGSGFNTGFFGPLTKVAVQRFQARYELPQTGFFGPLSRAMVAALSLY